MSENENMFENKDGENGGGGENNGNNSPQNSIEDMASVKTENPRGNIYCITIAGQIEGHNFLPPGTKTTKYEHVMPKLIEVEESSDIDGILILLNTVGGDVEAGLAIAEMIASLKKPTASLVLGGGHSIGVPLAVSSDRSFIVPSATMTVHPIRMSGTVIGVRQMFDYFSKVQERVISFVVNHSNTTYEKFESLMMETQKIANDIGTILFGEETVKSGIIDTVGGVSDALEYLYSRIAAQKSQNAI